MSYELVTPLQEVGHPRFENYRAFQRGRMLRYLADKHEGKKKRRLDPDLSLELPRGWLLPYLIEYDRALWGRWDYNLAAIIAGKLPEYPIPQIEWDCQRPFGGVKNRHVDGGIGYKHLCQCLDLIPNQGFGSWQGWSSFRNVDYFLDWLLYGFGYLEEQPPEPIDGKGASMRLYQFFDLAILQAYPWDYWGDILADSGYGQHLGFFPTPMLIVRLMGEVIYGNLDCRTESVYEPCCGTGRMLMVASNQSMNLYGQDISLTMVKCTIVNGYIYSPWLVKAPPCAKENKNKPAKPEDIPEKLEALPEASREKLPDSAAAPDVLNNFKPLNAWKGEEIRAKKGKNKGEIQGEQGCLF